MVIDQHTDNITSLHCCAVALLALFYISAVAHYKNCVSASG